MGMDDNTHIERRIKMILRALGEVKTYYNLVYYIDESKFTPEEKEAFDRLKANPDSSEYIELEHKLYDKYGIRLVMEQNGKEEKELIEVYKREFEEHPIENKDGEILAINYITQQVLVSVFGDKYKEGKEVFCHICGSKIPHDGMVYFNDLKYICKDCYAKIQTAKKKEIKKENDKDENKNIRGSYSVL